MSGRRDSDWRGGRGGSRGRGGRLGGARDRDRDRNQVCRHFLAGNCTFGAQCRYRHDPSLSNSETEAKDSRQSEPVSELYAEFQTWRFDIAKDAGIAKPPFRRAQFEPFWADALRFVTDASMSLRQEVIAKLASVGGEQRIIETIRHCSASNQTFAQFWAVMVPFLSVILNRQSKWVGEEQAHAGIYLAIYGVEGARVLDLLRASIPQLRSHITEPATAQLLRLVVELLRCILQRRTNFRAHDQLPEIVEQLELVRERFLPHVAEDNRIDYTRAADNLTVIKRVIRIHPSNEDAAVAELEQQVQRFKFTPDPELPASRRALGRRHSNDFDLIEDIQIMPSTGEIVSDHAEFLPKLDQTNPVLKEPVEVLLDRQFRLLREDTMGPIREALRLAIQPHETAGHPANGNEARYNQHHNIWTEALYMDRNRGPLLIVGLPQPKALKTLPTAKARQQWWAESKKLAPDTLVCLRRSTGALAFATIVDPTRITFDENDGARDAPREVPKYVPVDFEGNPQVNLHHDRKTAHVILSPVDASSQGIRQLLQVYSSSRGDMLMLVEFPNLLLISFRPILEALQTISISRGSEMPFLDIIAPAPGHANTEIRPPVYTLGGRFTHDLATITNGAALELSPRGDVDVALLSAASGMDATQTRAFVNGLTRSFAIIQGSPGCGKSFLGLQLVRTLLANKAKSGIGPIVALSYTNHALDQFLVELLEKGVKKVVRIGSRSKVKSLEELNLRVVAGKLTQTTAERHAESRAYGSRADAVAEARKRIVEFVRGNKKWAMMEYLKRNYPEWHEVIDPGAVDDEGYQQHVSHERRKDPIAWWLKRPGPNAVASRPSRPLIVLENEVDPNTATIEEKQLISRHWTETLTRRLADTLEEALTDYYKAKKALETVRQEKDLRAIDQASIIGLTTTGLATHIGLITALKPSVLVVEEAAEILESHLLAAMVPSIEHMILIGDHAQLRPQVNNYNLSTESQTGRQYSLDVSLFERLVSQPHPIPLDTLSTQRRMHPLISDLIRQTVYPDLTDHESVHAYPEVTGMKHRLFWLDHSVAEDSQTPAYGGKTMSKSNDHEVRLIVSLVRHLLRQGCYNGSHDLVVLTPYVRQLQLLRQALAAEFELLIDDRDLLELDKEAASSVVPAERPVSATTKQRLAAKLRIATVDNFQGEEATLVVASLVRSNAAKKCGFLRTSNRINVLLSRAKHGLFLVGDHTTFSSQPMWRRVLEIMQSGGRFGTHIPLCCPRHPDTEILVSTPEEFARLSPDGGCGLVCKLRLPRCGHVCKGSCHSESQHVAFLCQEPCERRGGGCEHDCGKLCGEQCEVLCRVLVYEIPLPCGHTAKTLRCHQAQVVDKVRCQETVTKTVPGCGHQVAVLCCTDVSSAQFTCTAPCGLAVERCSHACEKECRDCRRTTERPDGTVNVAYNHACTRPCPRNLSTCAHACGASCHDPAGCGSCAHPCETRCVHSTCHKRCNEPCQPCAEPCASGCEHMGYCKLPCAVPCEVLPCGKRCALLLPCGHQCPSVCGEVCPAVEFCQSCGSEKVKNLQADLLEHLSYAELDLAQTPVLVPPCGHLLTVDSMDGQMAMGEYFDLDIEGKIIAAKDAAPFSIDAVKLCAFCRGPMRDINRYSRIVKRAEIDRSTKRFIVWAQCRFLELERILHSQETQLKAEASGTPSFRTRNPGDQVADIPSQISSASFPEILTSLRQHTDRYTPVSGSLSSLTRLMTEVSREEQPFGKVFALSHQRRRIAAATSSQLHAAYPPELAQTRHELLVLALYLRTVIFLLGDLADVLPRVVGGGVTLDESGWSEMADQLVAQARERSQPGLETEGHLHFVGLICLARRYGSTDPADSALDMLVDAAREHLALAGEVIDSHPSLSATHTPLLEAAATMLNEGTFYTTVTSDEMRAVYDAMQTEFWGSGHWYLCANGHPFTIGECGMAMQVSSCPQCGAVVGGQGHQAAEGVTRAVEMESRMREGGT